MKLGNKTPVTRIIGIVTHVHYLASAVPPVDDKLHGSRYRPELFKSIVLISMVEPTVIHEVLAQLPGVCDTSFFKTLPGETKVESRYAVFESLMDLFGCYTTINVYRNNPTFKAMLVPSTIPHGFFIAPRRNPSALAISSAISWTALSCIP